MAKETVEIRPAVLWFAQQMELKLRENDHKSVWSKIPCERLLERLKGETDELEEQLQEKRLDYLPAEMIADRIIKEAADVANFAMMIADNSQVRETAREGRS